VRPLPNAGFTPAAGSAANGKLGRAARCLELKRGCSLSQPPPLPALSPLFVRAQVSRDLTRELHKRVSWGDGIYQQSLNARAGDRSLRSIVSADEAR